MTDTEDGKINGFQVDSRSAEWDAYKLDPDKIHEYKSTGNEYDEIISHYRFAGDVERLPHGRICGPTGSGKTLLTQNLAIDLAGNEESLPFFSITFSHGTRPKDLIGYPSIEDGDTELIEGTLTKALRASKEGPVVLLLDEINRAVTETKDALYEALDHRAQVSLEGLGGGEIVSGNPYNLLVVSTMNKGQGHLVESIDYAERRRLGPMWTTNYLGFDPDSDVNPVQDEVALLMARTPANKSLANTIVKTGNAIRNSAVDSTDVNYGVPTSNLLAWAKTASTYSKSGISNPVYKAGLAEVARSFYDGDENQQNEVKRIISTRTKDVRFNPTDEDPEFNETRFSCVDCGQAYIESELTDTQINRMVCPNDKCTNENGQGRLKVVN